MKPISVAEVRLFAFGIDEENSKCENCLFNDVFCSGCECAVGNVLKHLADEGVLAITDYGEKGSEE